MSKAVRMPWQEAVAYFGEAALKRGHSHQRVSNWRRDGVPGSVLIPLFKALVARLESTDPLYEYGPIQKG